MSILGQRKAVRSVMTTVSVMLGLVVVVYGVWLALLYYTQDRIVFPAYAAGQPAFAPFRQDLVLLDRPLPDHGGVVESWTLPAHSDPTANRPGPAVIYFHGNAELIDDQHDLADIYHRLGVTVMFVEYRGYGRSAGQASQESAVDDALWFYDRLAERDDVDATQIIVHGRSIGASVAAQLAGKRSAAGLILETGTPSIAALAWRYGAPPWMIRHPFRTDLILPTLGIPVLIFGAEHDTVFPVEHSRRLADLAVDATLVTFPTGHQGFPGPTHLDAYAEALKRYLGRAVGVQQSVTSPSRPVEE